MSTSMHVKACSANSTLDKFNPFDSDSESELSPGQLRASSVPALNKTKSRYSEVACTKNGGHETSDISSYSSSIVERKRYGPHVAGNQSIQELENYAVSKSEETTAKVNECLKLAEIIKEDATKTLLNLHSQGERIHGTHQMAANIDHDLSRGEKLLGGLGGLFSKTWKPKITRPIRGPAVSNDNFFTRMTSFLDEKQKLEVSPTTQRKSRQQECSQSSASVKIQLENEKQDEAFSDLSNVLGQLKDMAVDMGTEIDRHNKALDRLQDDVDELNYRTKGANQRARRLLGKRT